MCYLQIVLKLIFLIASLTYANEHGARVKRIVGGAPAGRPPTDDPNVYLRFGGRSARVRGMRDFPHFVFRGIRYAYPPVGKDRFQRPRQYFLSGDIDATVYPPPCPQPVPGENRIIGSEDCLFLNVFTPDLPTGTEGLPVVIWIHGGGFRYGSASQYGVNHLVGKRLVVVTIQYRLGSLGFLGVGSQELPGNSALWDMVLAVQWVRNHVGFFGGNPYKMVVMGHGTGASSALLVSLNDVAKGFTKGVVALSGTAVSHGAVDNNPDTTAKEVADLQGCPTTTPLAMIKCLQAISAASIVQVKAIEKLPINILKTECLGDSTIELNRLQSRGFVSGMQGHLGSMPSQELIFDGRSLPPMIEGVPLDKMVEKKNPNIPLLTGVTKDETKRAVHGQYEKEITTKLQSVPHFLDEVLLKNLQSFTGLGSKKSNNTKKDTNAFWNVLDPFQFRNYITVPKNNVRQGLGKIAEVTADALFNLPAFLTVDLWSKSGAPAFLYRFDHTPRKKRAHYFLNGLPIIGNNDDGEDLNNTVGHGDELAYLFEARSLNGTPISEMDSDFTAEDKKVRDIFTDMIATFARHGKIQVDNKDLPAFSDDKNNFMQVSSKPKIGNNFRFCEMALWAGLTQRLQSATCKVLSTIQSQLQNAEFMLFDTIPGIKNPVTQFENNIKDTQNKLTDAIKNPLGVFGGNNQNKPMESIKNPFNIFGGRR